MVFLVSFPKNSLFWPKRGRGKTYEGKKVNFLQNSLEKASRWEVGGVDLLMFPFVFTRFDLKGLPPGNSHVA